MAETKLQVGDSVVVKPGVEDPDLKIDIGGWQGRVSEVRAEDNVICIRWDSRTLREMPGETIDQCEEEGLDWTVMYLLVFPLCDLEVLDQSSPNYQPLRDYVVWFANR